MKRRRDQPERVRVHCTNEGSYLSGYSLSLPCGWIGYRRDVSRTMSKPCPACGHRVERSFPKREES